MAEVHSKPRTKKTASASMLTIASPNSAFEKMRQGAGAIGSHCISMMGKASNSLNVSGFRPRVDAAVCVGVLLSQYLFQWHRKFKGKSLERVHLL